MHRGRKLPVAQVDFPSRSLYAGAVSLDVVKERAAALPQRPVGPDVDQRQRFFPGKVSILFALHVKCGKYSAAQRNRVEPSAGFCHGALIGRPFTQLCSLRPVPR